MKTLFIVFVLLLALLFYIAMKPTDDHRRAALDHYIECLSHVLHEPPSELKDRAVQECQEQRREELR